MIAGYAEVLMKIGQTDRILCLGAARVCRSEVVAPNGGIIVPRKQGTVAVGSHRAEMLFGCLCGAA